MILLTVGSQLPFDRLVRAVDVWCGGTGRVDVFAQIGEPDTQGYRPKNFAWHTFVAPSVLDERMRQAELIVAHAGMGSIISALKYRKPIVIMPRRAVLGEHRNDHQHATAIRFADRRGIFVAEDETALPAAIGRALAYGASGEEALQPHAQPRLLQALRSYIFAGTTAEMPSSTAIDGTLREDRQT
jgi:UDP-N-acetylglucosamine transferase subunit ALG13